MRSAPAQQSGGRGPIGWWRRRDPLRRHRAVVGAKAQIRWWERARAIIGLVFMVLSAGIALAAIIGGFVLLAGLVLENAVR
ncbi:MAG: hypothetical protein KDB21_01620 [Acidimicrobiales bacterium]|nr:hypothetical protein [Acidimicrobiales bacterium]